MAALSFARIRAEICLKISTLDDLSNAKSAVSGWIKSPRKLDKITTIEQLLILLQKRSLFGPHKLNSLKLFKKLLNDDLIYSLVDQHEQILENEKPQPLINHYGEFKQY